MRERSTRRVRATGRYKPAWCFAVFTAACLASGLTACTTPPTAARADSGQQASEHEGRPPIRSRAALEAYLQHAATVGATTPLDALSPGARIRFIGSLRFGERGVGGFGTDDLSRELDVVQIEHVFAMFGEPGFARLVHPDPVHAKHETSTADQSAILSDLEQRYNRFYARAVPHHDESDLQASARVHRLFDQLFPGPSNPAMIARLDDNDLSLLSRAATKTSLITPSSHATSVMFATVRLMEERGIATDADLAGLYQTLVIARRFDQARRFATSHPQTSLPTLPALHDAIATGETQPTIWNMDRDGSLTRTMVDLQPLQILVLSGCHFSEDAARAIPADPVLGPVFREHARWLMLPPGQESIDDVREWNRKYPDAQAEMIHGREEWPMLDHWEMPTYVIVKDGKVLDRSRGWPPQPDRQHLLDMLTRAGLLPTGTQEPDAGATHDTATPESATPDDRH